MAGVSNNLQIFQTKTAIIGHNKLLFFRRYPNIKILAYFSGYSLNQWTFSNLLNVMSMCSHFQDKQVELHRVYLETDIKYK